MMMARERSIQSCFGEIGRERAALVLKVGAGKCKEGHIMAVKEEDVRRVQTENFFCFLFHFDGEYSKNRQTLEKLICGHIRVDDTAGSITVMSITVLYVKY